ncbi:MAG: selenobiotic family peptide radical SAM maturase [Desulfuromonas sp.]|nr:MAG: selenobiotic family peptide radical SAM maturase [Desulfuromonas sp.]
MLIRLNNIFQASSRYLSDDLWRKFERLDPADLPEALKEHSLAKGDAAFLPDMARVELYRHRLRNSTPGTSPKNLDTYQVNPTLALLEVNWRSLLACLDDPTVAPEPGEDRLLFWRDPRTGFCHEASASAPDLLALKIVVEKLAPEIVAEQGGTPVGTIDAVLAAAVDKGLLMAPASRLQRIPPKFPAPAPVPEPYRTATVFTLQWHITHRCDLHCRHCYDRTLRRDVDFEQGLEALDQMRSFCRTHHVRGQVSFSGGNPFLHPDFVPLYRAAHERNLTPAILGNPVSAAQLDEVIAIVRPAFFQVSLEGLQEHNDRIRGHGSFDAVLRFLDLLRSRNVYSMVMLTLTSANLDQVLPLAGLLKERANLLTFNRLAMVGEGANLASPGKDAYHNFVKQLLEARKTNPILALKDSLINIELDSRQSPLFGGCTGFGCGAAFNFVSLLPDGEVHACRKFPSLIGNLYRDSLDRIYHSDGAEAYRQGCRECDDCRLRAMCGGCLAVAYGYGLDPLQSKDPGCFLETSAN